MSDIEIKPFTVEIIGDLLEHLQRQRTESGSDGLHFMPFAPDDPNGPTGIAVEKALLPLDTPGWQRWFYAREIVSGKIIGHVDLKGDGLKTGLHRCELGIGIEQTYRGQGLGKKLVVCAIDFARENESLSWIELRVFANNTDAHSLYQSFGFEEAGMLKDRFRIGDEKIDDIVMVLNVD